MDQSTSSSTIVIRRIAPGDAQALQAFYNGLSPASKRTFRPLAEQTGLAECENIVRDNTGAACAKHDLVAVDGGGDAGGDAGGRIVGWSFVWDLNGVEPVFGLAVADAYHGRGLGSGLMDSVLQAMRQRGLPRLYLTVVQDNLKAWHLYERRGFVKYGEFVGEDGLPYFRMSANLEAS